MRIALACAGLMLGAAALASGPGNFSRQWPVLGNCPPDQPAQAGLPESALACEGAFAVTLDESVYRQVAHRDLSDVAAFNADGDALAFGPMPASYSPAPGIWRQAAWFALPPVPVGSAQDLHLHVSRSTDGNLSLDATLSRNFHDKLQDFLIDVRAPRREVESIALELAPDAPDFSADVTVEASEDLQHWRTVVPAATVAQLRQGGQTLVRRHVEFSPVSATYLRVRTLGSTGGIPLTGVRLELLPQALASEAIRRSVLAADFLRRDGRAFVFRVPARVPVERVNVVLKDDNAIANFSVSARDSGERDWTYVGQMSSFRLRAAGVALDNESMDVTGPMRQQEWRIEPNIELEQTPRLELSYRPERWLLLTHGKAPFVVAAGSRSARRGEFPLEALVSRVRDKYGKDWQPAPVSLGAMQTAGGDAALTSIGADQKRTWALWAVLVLGAAVIVAMVLRLLKAPQEP